MTTIPASYDTLFEQAKDTVESYLRCSIRLLTEQFGEGYAAENPQLVGQLVASMVADFNGALFGKTVGELSDVISTLDFGRD